MFVMHVKSSVSATNCVSGCVGNVSACRTGVVCVVVLGSRYVVLAWLPLQYLIGGISLMLMVLSMMHWPDPRRCIPGCSHVFQLGLMQMSVLLGSITEGKCIVTVTMV